MEIAFELAITECEISAQAFESMNNPDAECRAMGEGHRKTKAELEKFKPTAVWAIDYLATPRNGEHPDQWMRDLLLSHGATFADSPLGWKEGIVQHMNELAAVKKLMREAR